MATRQYIGARYVPLQMGEWDSAVAYEPLSVVQYQGASYTSKQHVPAGIEITDADYWVLSADYNAQVAQYRMEVKQYTDTVTSFDERITDNTEKIETKANATDVGCITPEKYGAVGDGTTDDTAAVQAAIDSHCTVTGKGGSVYKVNNLKLADNTYLANIHLVSEGTCLIVESNHSIIDGAFIESLSPATENGANYGIETRRPALQENPFIKIQNCFIKGFSRGISAGEQAGFSCLATKFLDNYRAIYSLATDIKVTNCITKGRIGIETQPGLEAVEWHHWCWIEDYEDSVMLIPISYGIFHLTACTGDTVETTVKVVHQEAANSVISFDSYQYYLNPTVVNHFGSSFSAPSLCDDYTKVRIIMNSATMQLTASSTPVNYMPYDNRNVYVGNIVAYGSQSNNHNAIGIQDRELEGGDSFTPQVHKFLVNAYFKVLFANGILAKALTKDTEYQIMKLPEWNGSCTGTGTIIDASGNYHAFMFYQKDGYAAFKAPDNISGGTFSLRAVDLNLISS